MESLSFKSNVVRPIRFQPFIHSVMRYYTKAESVHMTTRDITEVLHVGGVYTGVPLTLEETECEWLETGMRREELCTGECPPVQPTQQSGNKYKPCIYCTASN